jgi:hypothetical protein
VTTSPRRRIVLAAAGVALLLAGAVVLVTGGESEPDNTAVLPDATAFPDLPVPSPTDAPEEPTPQPNRQDCGAILGTPYQSDDEAEWFRSNCANVDAPSVPAAGSAQVPIGDRLIIPSAGVDTTISRATVPPSGRMPDPVGYFNAVWYDFTNFSDLGGYVNAGNLVLSGHVDCARCINGGPGRAVFYSIRSLGLGDTARYETADGKVVEYEVVLSQAFSPSALWEPILASTAADLTLITCTGTFSGGEYNLRHVVQMKKKS